MEWLAKSTSSHSSATSSRARRAPQCRPAPRDIAQSIGSKGDCSDNGVSKSVFATLKEELMHGRSWPPKAELRTEVFEYIEGRRRRSKER